MLDSDEDENESDGNDGFENDSFEEEGVEDECFGQACQSFIGDYSPFADDRAKMPSMTTIVQLLSSFRVRRIKRGLLSFRPQDEAIIFVSFCYFVQDAFSEACYDIELLSYSTKHSI